MRALILGFLFLSSTAFAGETGINLKWNAPVTRENGDVLTPEELGPYKLYIHVAGAVVHEVDIESDISEMRLENLEQWSQGLIGFTMTASDNTGLVSLPSHQIDINIAAPTTPTITISW